MTETEFHDSLFFCLFHRRRLEGAAASSGGQFEGVCDGGGGEGKESYDLCAPARGSLQHSTGILYSAEERCGFQPSGMWSQSDEKNLFTSSQ